MSALQIGQVMIKGQEEEEKEAEEEEEEEASDMESEFKAAARHSAGTLVHVPAKGLDSRASSTQTRLH